MNERGVHLEVTKASFDHEMIYLNKKFFLSESKHSQAIESTVGENMTKASH